VVFLEILVVFSEILGGWVKEKTKLWIAGPRDRYIAKYGRRRECDVKSMIVVKYG
jgi:hypothetical protein